LAALALVVGCGARAAGGPSTRSAGQAQAQPALPLAADADAIVWLRPPALDRASFESLIATGDWADDMALRRVLRSTRVIHVGFYAQSKAIVMVFEGRYDDIELGEDGRGIACDGSWAGMPCIGRDGSTRIFRARDQIVFVEAPGAAPSPPGPQRQRRIEDPAPAGLIVRSAAGVLAFADWSQTAGSLARRSVERAFASTRDLRVRGYPRGGELVLEAELRMTSRREAEAARELLTIVRSFEPQGVDSIETRIEPGDGDWILQVQLRGLALESTPARAPGTQP
jgi:hypothetical protein